MLEPTLIDRIRRIFLQPRPHVSILSATILLGWSSAEMNDAIAAGEVELMETPFGKWFWREELMAKALEQWPREVIEEALGEDAERVLPRAVRLAVLRARVPRYQVAMLEYFAERDRTTVSAVLTSELDHVASAHSPELTLAIPGFRAALAWPEAQDAQSPC